MVHVPKSASLILNEMQDSSLPVVVSHGEGRADFALHGGNISADLGIALQYVDGQNQVTQTYPLNPNGSPQGIAGDYQRRLPRYHYDAPPRTRVPCRTNEPETGRLDGTVRLVPPLCRAHVKPWAKPSAQTNAV